MSSPVLDGIRNFLIFFSSILYEALPFIVLGSIIAGFLEEFVPQRWVVRLIPRNRVLAIAMGGLLGLPFPMCECGILVVMRRLLRKGVPLSCCVTYMLAGPIINVVVMLSTYVAFSGVDSTNASTPATTPVGGLGMMGLRMGMGYLVAFVTGLIVEMQHRRHGDKLLAPLTLRDAKTGADDADVNGRPKPPLSRRLGAVSEIALHDFVDVMAMLVIGALIAAGFRLVLSRATVEHLGHNSPGLAILAMMGLAIVLCLCSEADAFVAASFTGMPTSALLGFLVLGPMLDFKLYMMYLRVYRPRLIWTIIGSVVVQVWVYSFLFHIIWVNRASLASWFSFSSGGS